MVFIAQGVSCRTIDDYESEISVECNDLYDRCDDDSVCCSQYCWKPLHVIWNGGICSDHVPTLDDVTYLDGIISNLNNNRYSLNKVGGG